MPPLPVTAAQALLTSIGNNARQLIDPRGDFLFDPAGFIADPNPPFITSRPAKAVARAACRAWARRPGDSTNPAADRLYAAACGPYLDSIGESPEPGSIGLPFTGGQCPGVQYRVTLDAYSTNGAFFGRTTQTGAGPVTVAPSGNQTQPPGSPSCPTGQTYFPGRVLRFNGVGRVSWGGGCAVRETTEIISVVRVDGAPDTCGNPPPEYFPPRRIINLPPIIPIFVDLPDIGEVNVTVELFPDASFQLCSDDVDACVTINPPGAPDPAEEPGGDVGAAIAPGGGTPGPQADTGDGGTAEGQAPDGQELVGVRVEVLEFPVGANRFQNNLAEPFRGIGYVRMGYPNRLAIDVSAGVVISPQFFLAPTRGLTNWEVRANVGFINRVTPFYRELPT